LAEPLRDRLAPLHWPLELPEALAAGGFDAIVGNPPFVGGRRISTTLGDDHARWLARRYDGSKNADLCAFFFRRAGELLAEDGAAGLLATNTIGQGDTRETGLAVLVERGAVIYDATAARAWPGDASVTLSIVHFARGEAARRAGRPRLDGAPVTAINSRLRPGAERPPPRRLPERRGESFQGTVVLGRGFLLTPAERDALVAEAPANAERIAPYVGGEEVNTSPTQAPRRHVIDFGALELHEAARWPTLLERLRRDVKPARDRVKRKALRERWWRHADHRPGLYEAVRGLSRCLVNSQVSRHLIFAFQPTGRVYAHTLYVYPFCDYARFALLQSRVHGAWARLLASTLGSAGLRYTSTDCFDTFPFPPARALAKGGALELAGAAAHALRAELAARRELGLTAIYNRLRDRACDDPAIARLRELHLELDRAALAAYELSITPPPYVAPRDADEARALAAFEEAVIDRLYALNAARG
ncbi:MAG: hypothetical protein KC636_33920, partial [Myxococcales bacterium]|nr:hypothetical protein [Myxococcales bacterium]